MNGPATFTFTTGETFELTLSTRTTYDLPKNRRTEVSLEGSVPKYAAKFLSIVTPILRVLAAFDAIPPENSPIARIYNIKSLTDNYKNGFLSMFTMTVDEIGVVNVNISINPEATVAMSVESNFDPRDIKFTYTDSKRNHFTREYRPYLAYQKASDNGGIKFLQFTETYVSLISKDSVQPKLTLKIEGQGLYNGACLLNQNSWLNTQDFITISHTKKPNCLVRNSGGVYYGRKQLYCNDSPILIRRNIRL